MAKRNNTTTGAKQPKKFMVFVVEGKNDINALMTPLVSFFDLFYPQYNVQCIYQEPSGGDITSSDGIKPANIENKIYTNVILPWLTRTLQTTNTNDIAEVVLLSDTDGAFVNENAVKFDDTALHIKYDADVLYTRNVKDTIARNNQKKANMQKASSLKKLKNKVPFATYYFSCNLDDILFSEKNASCQEKKQVSENFGKFYEEDVEGFLRFFLDSNSTSTIGMTYEESWLYLENNKHSLERRTNFNVFLERMIAESHVALDVLPESLRVYLESR